MDVKWEGNKNKVEANKLKNGEEEEGKAKYDEKELPNKEVSHKEGYRIKFLKREVSKWKLFKTGLPKT